MEKYYCVRTKEQWEWLVNRFGQSETQWPEQGMSFGEIRECLASGGFVIVHNDYFPSVGSVLYTAAPQDNGNVIEVSDLMEGEKMKDYVTIKDEDLKKIEMFRGNESKGNLRELWDVNKVNIPKSLLYPKVCMSVAEKKELDKLKDEMSLDLDRYDLDDLLTRIKDSEVYPRLYHRLYVADGDGVESQLEFARAWADPSLIEVIPEKKFKIKVPNSYGSYYFKSRNGKIQASYENIEDHRFLFEQGEIEFFHLQNYEKVEVTE